MFNFTPKEDANQAFADVPHYDEARKEDGWQGHTTSRSLETLKSDVVAAMGRVGGLVHSFQRGSYTIGGQEREGIVIHYSVEGPGGQMVYGRLDIAALPYKPPYGGNRSHSRYKSACKMQEDKALRMALYNVAEALRAQWVLSQLNPAYVPLMPWMIGDNKSGMTLSQAYLSEGYGRNLLPPGEDGDKAIRTEFEPDDEEAVEGEFTEK
jgi:hypothetical protein